MAETLLSAYTGGSRTSASDLHIVQPALGTDFVAHGVRWSGAPFKPAPYYGLRVGWFAADDAPWGVALDFTHYKVYARTGGIVDTRGTWMRGAVTGVAPLDRYVQRFELSHGVNMLSVNAVRRWTSPRLFSGRLQPYVGAGPAWYLPHAESVVGAVPHEASYRPAGFAVHVLAGAQYRVSDRVVLFAEGKADRGRARVDVASGSATTSLRTVHLASGIALRF